MIPAMPNHAFSRNRRGLSLAEMAFALLVIGTVLGGVWMAAGHIYRNWDVTQTEKQLGILYQSARQAHLNGSTIDDQTLMQLGLPADMLGHYKGQTLIYNRWRGGVTVFPGNAMGWGRDSENNEYTIRLDGIPQAACTPLVLHAQTMRSWGLLAVYMAVSPDKGKLICFDEDSFCKSSVTMLIEDQIKHYCALADRMIVMYTFGAN